MQVKLAFQHSLKDSASIRNIIETKAIQLWTRSKYFHVEIIIDNVWISSGPTYGGVYLKELKPLNVNSYDYINIDVDVSNEQLEKLFKFLEAQEGSGYDWSGIIFSQTFDFNTHNGVKWFCSEIVAEILKRLGVKLDKYSNQYSPKDLFDTFTRFDS